MCIIGPLLGALLRAGGQGVACFRARPSVNGAALAALGCGARQAGPGRKAGIWRRVICSGRFPSAATRVEVSAVQYLLPGRPGWKHLHCVYPRHTYLPVCTYDSTAYRLHGVDSIGDCKGLLGRDAGLAYVCTHAHAWRPAYGRRSLLMVGPAWAIVASHIPPRERSNAFLVGRPQMAWIL